MSKISTEKSPVTPGEILLGEFLEPLGITQRDFAKAIGVTPAYVSDIVHGRRGVSAEMALRFEVALKMPARFWLTAQLACDLYAIERDKDAAAKRRKIKPLNAAA
ncbi:MAG TPA: HigA family addiction module antitoxin [Candidatus Baltobacteraceae bacterium]|jgi:addiction module HigA family antidote|nr:HigA family addiction module antitoxin [Candidatus Baltobacteraceae bacterium]